jgi:hydrogenase maturation factor
MQREKRAQSIRYIINAAIIVLLVLIFYFGTRPPHIDITENHVKISGLYGVELRVDDIEQLQMRETLPPIKTRTNGMDLFGIARRGIYQLEELGRTRMISFSAGGPFVLIHTGNEWIVINYKETDKTESLYQQLEAVVDN